jgi:hypothetical protein
MEKKQHKKYFLVHLRWVLQAATKKFRPRLERRKTIGKSKDSVPKERKSVCPSGMKELETTVPEERLPDLYF